MKSKHVFYGNLFFQSSQNNIVIDRVALAKQRDNRFGSIRPFVCLFLRALMLEQQQFAHESADEWTDRWMDERYQVLYPGGAFKTSVLIISLLC